MDYYSFRIPIETLANCESKDRLCSYFSKLEATYTRVQFEISDNSELIITEECSNDVGVRRFSDLLTIIAFTKEDIEKALLDNGVSTAHCYIEFEARKMW